MQFKPLNEDKKNEYRPLDEGRYKMKVVDVLDTFSKSGNPMFKMTLDVESKYGKRRLFDYLVCIKDEQGEIVASKKLKSFAQSAGIEDKFNQGELLDGDCMHKEVEAQVVIEDDPKYGKQNKIIYYVNQPKSDHGDFVKGMGDEFIDESLPF